MAEPKSGITLTAGRALRVTMLWIRARVTPGTKLTMVRVRRGWRVREGLGGMVFEPIRI